MVRSVCEFISLAITPLSRELFDFNSIDEINKMNARLFVHSLSSHKQRRKQPVIATVASVQTKQHTITSKKSENRKRENSKSIFVSHKTMTLLLDCRGFFFLLTKTVTFLRPKLISKTVKIKLKSYNIVLQSPGVHRSIKIKFYLFVIIFAHWECRHQHKQNTLKHFFFLFFILKLWKCN